MSSKRRQRRKQCEGKIAYDSSGAAQGSIYGAWQRGHRVHSYRCSFCNQFHIGHPTRSQRQSLAAKRRNAS